MYSLDSGEEQTAKTGQDIVNCWVYPINASHIKHHNKSDTADLVYQHKISKIGLCQQCI